MRLTMHKAMRSLLFEENKETKMLSKMPERVLLKSTPLYTFQKKYDVFIIRIKQIQHIIQ